MSSYEITVRRCEDGTYYAQCAWGGVESATLEKALAHLARCLTKERTKALKAFEKGEFEIHPEPSRRIQSGLIASLGLPNEEESADILCAGESPAGATDGGTNA